MSREDTEKQGVKKRSSPKSIRQWPESERPRERLLKWGADRLSSAELIAILLGSGVKGRSAVEVARDCLDIPLREMSADRLSRISGLGPGKIARIMAGLEMGRRLLAEGSEEDLRLRSSAEVYTYVRPQFLGRKEEVFSVLLLDTKNRPQRMIEIARGNGESVHFLLVDLFQKVVQEKASALICVHNHPSGDPKPSPEDEHLTQKLREGAHILGLRFLDHIILGHSSYYSFADHGA